ncbi:hypothetical protein TNCV_251001 [Trichonephila clavipes]|nr:hypothetical protein TNCV_251001 [Trichonephila clavipes]
MDVCKCIVPLRHGGTLNSRRAASPLVMFVEGEERWEAPDHPPGCSPSKAPQLVNDPFAYAYINNLFGNDFAPWDPDKTLP